MANAFLRKTVTAGTSRTDVLASDVASATEVVCIGLIASNKSSASRTLTVEIKYDTGTPSYTSYITNIPIPVGSSVNLLDGGKLVLVPNENLTVTADSASAVDVHLSYLEIT
jgi:hypothetical protein